MNIILSPSSPDEVRKIEKREDIPKLGTEYPMNTAVKYNGRFQRGEYCSLEECEGLTEFCLDVGVCNLFGQNLYEWIVGLGSRLKMILLRDAAGFDNSHLAPFTSVYEGISNTNWYLVFKALNTIEFDGTIVIDCWDNLLALPNRLRKPYMAFLEEMKNYLEWNFSMNSLVAKHDRRVLFGAGNMCRNYMLMYGEQFPPLFTCDNNSARWGDSIDGLEIKNPEVLKELDDDIAIYICNIYYDEIQMQLEQMGIKNPIERFSDEYLPKTHMDRMEMWKG